MVLVEREVLPVVHVPLVIPPLHLEILAVLPLPVLIVLLDMTVPQVLAPLDVLSARRVRMVLVEQEVLPVVHVPLVIPPLHLEILAVLPLPVLIVLLDMTVPQVLAPLDVLSARRVNIVLEGQVLLPVVHVPLDIPLLVQALVAVMIAYVLIVLLDMTVSQVLLRP